MLAKCMHSVPGAMQRCPVTPRMGPPSLQMARPQHRRPGPRLICLASSSSSATPPPEDVPQAAAPQQPEAEAQPAETPVVEATNVIEPDEQGTPTGPAFLPRLPDTVNNQAQLIYTALAGLFAIQGVGLAASAWCLPTLMLPAGTAAGPLGTTLLGCAAATALQAAGLMIHLRGSVSVKELGTWRHQRVGMVVILYCASVLLGCLPAITSAPALAGLCALIAVGGAVGCGLVVRSCLPHQPWLQWSLFPGDLASTCESLVNFLYRDITSFAGLICLVWMAVSVVGATGVMTDVFNWQLFTGAASLVPGLHPLYPYGTSPQSAAVLDMLRHMTGSGLTLSAITAHCLLEVAMSIRSLPILDYIKTCMVQSMAEGMEFYQVARPAASRFTLLTVVGVVLAALVQGAFLLSAPNLGVDLNKDVLLMGPLHWSLMLSALYALVALVNVNWKSVKDAGMWGFGLLAAFIAAVTENLVVKKEWMEDAAKP